MAFSDLNVVDFLKAKMRWHQGRQRVLAQNIANADTPGYRAVDLKPMQFKAALKSAAVEPVAAMRTSQSHIATALPGADRGFATRDEKGWEITPGGNAVVLEEQMIKVSENQFDYQLASTLYSRSLGLLRTAIGRGK